MSLDLDQLVLAPCHAVLGETNRGFPTPVYTPQAGQPFDIDGVFRIPEIPVLAEGNEPSLMTRAPVLDIRVSQCPAGVVPAQGDNVVVRGVDYTVSDAAYDGDGLVVLSLREAPP